ncbi:CRISPR-associated protein Csx19 [Paracoccus sp. YLB-12]|uniref:CRISPR-associated protein Csx19 n=1 Tax=Paracoccus maritimus TaxID=2933292 RepID=A0ABT2KDT6_9RHOB|nr:CRISPR-associated protein Csx19 [Paracoccus sp. YLB-12]MCT4334711.1 CRISPR-associated protein Csx19 [Paracoccus sp. YLB-12]
MSIPVELHRWCWPDLTIHDALALCCGFAEPLAITMSPAECRFADLSGASLLGPDGEALDLSQVYQLHVMTGETELHWLRRDGGTGLAGAVAEAASPAAWGWPEAEVETAHQMANKLMLWGKSLADDSTGAAWSRLAAARIGEIKVPHPPLAESERLALWRYSYFVPGEDGNLRLRATRLAKFDTISEPQP